MDLSQVRNRYLKFFERNGHTIIPSSSLIPENDPTTLFTGAGMQPILPYLLGKAHPESRRLVNVQKCFRAEDIEEVGDNRHTTFFEMLGNWSLGDYFKTEQLEWFYSFLIDDLGLPPERLYVTCFSGDDSLQLPRDMESVAIWKRLFARAGIDAKEVELRDADYAGTVGMQGGRIFFYGSEKNWWSRAGAPAAMPEGEPGGPDSEVFFEFADVSHKPEFGDHCHPNCDCGRFLEIGNSVFMEYVKRADGSFDKLPQRNVDFGGGLERITAAILNSPDIFNISTLKNSVDRLSRLSNISYDKGDRDTQRAFRIIADHIRAAVFMIGAGITPGNKERGYILRRLIRRALLNARKLNLKDAGWLETTVSGYVDDYKEFYEELDENQEEIKSGLTIEAKKFIKTLESGLKEFEKQYKLMAGGKQVSPNVVFDLVTTFGFPIELVREVAAERGLTIDESAFEKEMEKHRTLSRAGSEKKFKGGLADTSVETTKLHTAHHLLLKALQIVLGPQVKQRGSNITSERLRIDFSYGGKLTDKQKEEVERIVNEKIKENLPVIQSHMAKEEAEKLGAEHEFGAKYPDRVSVYSIGELKNAFSIEFCGGPHVERTGVLGNFKILKEEAVSAGIRRIKAILE